MRDFIVTPAHINVQGKASTKHPTTPAVDHPAPLVDLPLGRDRDAGRNDRGQSAPWRLNDGVETQARWIAQMLHDEAGQFLTAAHLALADAERGLPRDARKRVQEARNHLFRIEEQLRRLAHELHPQILDDLGLVPAIAFLVQGFEKRHGISVAVDADAAIRLAPRVESTVYRLVQEALTNVSRHARAVEVTICLRQEPGVLHCKIADNGIGFDGAVSDVGTPMRGLGLTGIRDRLNVLGGTLAIVWAPGHGTAMHVTIPIDGD